MLILDTSKRWLIMRPQTLFILTCLRACMANYLRPSIEAAGLDPENLLQAIHQKCSLVLEEVTNQKPGKISGAVVKELMR